MGTVIETPGRTIIMNGGQTLKDCPKTQEESQAWANQANATSQNKEHETPEWSWDCGYKLDYDGAIVGITSRFYPPSEYYGATWDGESAIYINGEEVINKKFDCETLEQLKSEVEVFSNLVINAIKSVLENLCDKKEGK